VAPTGEPPSSVAVSATTTRGPSTAAEVGAGPSGSETARRAPRHRARRPSGAAPQADPVVNRKLTRPPASVGPRTVAKLQDSEFDAPPRLRGRRSVRRWTRRSESNELNSRLARRQTDATRDRRSRRRSGPRPRRRRPRGAARVERGATPEVSVRTTSSARPGAGRRRRRAGAGDGGSTSLRSPGRRRTARSRPSRARGPGRSTPARRSIAARGCSPRPRRGARRRSASRSRRSPRSRRGRGRGRTARRAARPAAGRACRRAAGDQDEPPSRTSLHACSRRRPPTPWRSCGGELCGRPERSRGRRRSSRRASRPRPPASTDETDFSMSSTR
jgi:hypothetical protein